MSAFSKIVGIANTMQIPAYPDVYPDDDLNTWITYNLAEEHGDLFADDAPGSVIQSVQVHLFVRTGRNYTTLKNTLRDALFAAGFTWPEVTTIFEAEQKLRHIVFECQFDDTLTEVE